MSQHACEYALIWCGPVPSDSLSCFCLVLGRCLFRGSFQLLSMAEAEEFWHAYPDDAFLMHAHTAGAKADQGIQIA